MKQFGTDKCQKKEHVHCKLKGKDLLLLEATSSDNRYLEVHVTLTMRTLDAYESKGDKRTTKVQPHVLGEFRLGFICNHFENGTHNG